MSEVICPVINEKKFKEIVDIIREKYPAFDNNLKTMSICKKTSNKTKSRRRSHGGARSFGITEAQIKTAIYVILAFLFGISAVTSETLHIGLSMLLKGQCGFFMNRLFFQNSVCTIANGIITTVGRAIQFDPYALGQLTMGTLFLIKFPTNIDIVVTQLAKTISEQTGALITDTTGNVSKPIVIAHQASNPQIQPNSRPSNNNPNVVIFKPRSSSRGKIKEPENNGTINEIDE